MGRFAWMAVLGLVACTVPQVAAENGEPVATVADAGPDAAEQGDSAASANADSEAGAASGNQTVCVPGAQTSCACPGVTSTGIQVCAADGSALGSCIGCLPPTVPTGSSSSGGPACTKKSCSEEFAFYDNYGPSLYLCGRTPDDCGGTQQCTRACAYGVCEQRTGVVVPMDMCSCWATPAQDGSCKDPARPHYVVCSGTVAAGCTPVFAGSTLANCCS